MEDYLTRRNYLNHLKHLSAIKNGHHRPSFSPSTPRLSNINFHVNKDNTLNMNNTSSLFRLTKKSTGPFSSRNKSTQQIMKNFTMQKENLRLVQRIGTMSSQINMRKYQKQYNESKKLMKIHSKIKKPKQLFKFKIFDIKFQQFLPDPQQTFTIYELYKQKKKFITQGTLFELKRQQLLTTKKQKHHIKIQGKSWGIVELKIEKNLLPIKRNKEEVGSLVIEII